MSRKQRVNRERRANIQMKKIHRKMKDDDGRRQKFIDKLQEALPAAQSQQQKNPIPVKKVEKSCLFVSRFV